MLLTSPQGMPVHAGGGAAFEPAGHLVLLCGRYEGVDERVRARVDEELSIGDYVLSGGELAALVDRRRGCAAGSRAWSATSGRWRRIRSAGGCWTFRTTRGRRRCGERRIGAVGEAGEG